MATVISLILSAVIMIYMSVALLTGWVSGGQFIGAVLLALVFVNAIDYFKEQIRERRKKHEQTADAGAEKEDC